VHGSPLLNPFPATRHGGDGQVNVHHNPMRPWLRASELLTVAEDRVDPASQLIGVVRKGSRALQMLPASADAFVWLRLYQHRLDAQVPRGPDAPLWWTLRRPVRPLTYDAARMMFGRAQDALGSNWVAA
jgi:hypothetical protein